MTILVIDFSFLLLSGGRKKEKVASFKRKETGEIEILTRAIDSSDGLCVCVCAGGTCRKSVSQQYTNVSISLYIYIPIDRPIRWSGGGPVGWGGGGGRGGFFFFFPFYV